jgi:ribulose-5-phosphate 4-epimerase/fuculose-1-phosphate aldolase
MKLNYLPSVTMPTHEALYYSFSNFLCVVHLNDRLLVARTESPTFSGVYRAGSTAN